MLLNKEVYFPIKIFTTTAPLLLTEDMVVFSQSKCTIQSNFKKANSDTSNVAGERNR